MNLDKKEMVVLLHGLGRSHLQMKVLERFLKRNHYHVLNINYPSTKQTIKTLAQHIWQTIQTQGNHHSTCHLIGYSLGGVIIQAMLQSHPSDHIGKIILLGAPNHGSPIADKFKNHSWFKSAFGPAGVSLGSRGQLIYPLPKSITQPIGCIASSITGCLSITYPLSSFFIEKPHDGRVTTESAQLETMSDYLEIQCPHFYMPFSATIRQPILYFLKNGTFSKKDPGKCR